MPPPPLAWIDGFVLSLGRALGQRVEYTLEGTSPSPLVFHVRLKFSEKVSGKNMLLAWNLFQMYATKNDSVPQGKAAEPNSLLAEVAIKRRLGPVRNRHPLEK